MYVTPFFSVVIPLYNKEKDVAATLQSVLSQMFSNFEIVVVDDGSTDRSKEVVDSFNDERIRYYYKDNGGEATARNYGVKLSRAEYIAFIDADDYWYANHLLMLNKLIVRSYNANWFGAAYEIRYNKTLTMPMRAPIQKNQKKGWMGSVGNYFENTLQDTLVNSSSVCFKKSFFIQLGGFNTSYTEGTDTDMWIRAALSSELYFINEITSRYEHMASNRLSFLPIKQKTELDTSAFLVEEKTNNSLNIFMDRIRYSFAIRYKIEKDRINFLRYKKQLLPSNLTKVQSFLLNQNRIVLLLLLFLKNAMEFMGIRIRTSYK